MKRFTFLAAAGILSLASCQPALAIVAPTVMVRPAQAYPPDAATEAQDVPVEATPLLPPEKDHSFAADAIVLTVTFLVIVLSIVLICP